MAYIQGFLAAVSNDKKEAYRKMTETVWPVFAENGCLSSRENWGVDVQDGEVTSFPMAVKLEKDETVVFSWMEWPDRQTCDAAWEKIMQDPRMTGMTEMPFDGKRMIWGGFEELVKLDANK